MPNNTNTHPYTVTGIKSFRGREGYGFNATLHRDGRKVAFVIDQADGGECRYEWLAKDRTQAAADEQALTDYCATLPPTEFAGHTLAMNTDMLLSELVESAENAQRIARALKKHVVFVDEGTLLQSKAAPSAALIAAIRQKRPSATILNDLPKGEAVALFTQYAGA